MGDKISPLLSRGEQRKKCVRPGQPCEFRNLSAVAGSYFQGEQHSSHAVRKINFGRTQVQKHRLRMRTYMPGEGAIAPYED